MSQRVLIVGQHTAGTPLRLPDIDPSAKTPLAKVFSEHKKAASSKHWYSAVERANGVDELVSVLDSVCSTGGPIGILDILDHGAPGGIMLGDEILFRSDKDKLLDGKDVVPRLTPFLTETAHLRLLGCQTGLGITGQRLLWELGAVFGEHRIVFGTIDRVFVRHFTKKDGFNQAMELLYSSLAGFDYVAPHMDERVSRILHWYP